MINSSDIYDNNMILMASFSINSAIGHQFS